MNEESELELTQESVEGEIVNVQFHHFPGTLMTTCCATLKNGFSVVGASACIKKEDFDEQKGRDIAYSKAVIEVFDLLAYTLKTKLSEAS